MARIEEWVTLGIPAEAAYERWSRLRELPRAMDGVEEVREHEDGTRTTWTIRLGAQRVSFATQTTEVVPGRRISWRSISGPRHTGSVSFVALEEDGCAVVVEAEGDASGALGHAGTLLGLLRQRIREDLAGFKLAAETAHTPTPAQGAIAA